MIDYVQYVFVSLWADFPGQRTSLLDFIESDLLGVIFNGKIILYLAIVFYIYIIYLLYLTNKFEFFIFYGARYYTFSQYYYFLLVFHN